MLRHDNQDLSESSINNRREHIIKRLSFAHDLVLQCLTLRDEILRPELVRIRDQSQESDVNH